MRIKTYPTNFRLTAEERDKIDAIAKATRRKRSDVVHYLISQATTRPALDVGIVSPVVPTKRPGGAS